MRFVVPVGHRKLSISIILIFASSGAPDRISFRCPDAFPEGYRSSEERRWTDATKLGVQDASRLDYPFKHESLRELLLTFDASIRQSFKCSDMKMSVIAVY